jgi:hypothetical protein
LAQQPEGGVGMTPLIKWALIIGGVLIAAMLVVKFVFGS